MDCKKKHLVLSDAPPTPTWEAPSCGLPQVPTRSCFLESNPMPVVCSDEASSTCIEDALNLNVVDMRIELDLRVMEPCTCMNTLLKPKS